jgi:hypothetical protein
MHEATMHSLHEWFKKEFEKFGWMLLKIGQEGSKDKFECYKRELAHLKSQLETKKSKANLPDYKNYDVTLMINDVTKLIEYADNYLPPVISNPNPISDKQKLEDGRRRKRSNSRRRRRKV